MFPDGSSLADVDPAVYEAARERIARRRQDHTPTTHRSHLAPEPPEPEPDDAVQRRMMRARLSAIRPAALNRL